MKKQGCISRAELLEAALKDPAFRARYEASLEPFSKILVEMRAKVGLTQREVAERAGVGRPLVSMIESGHLGNSRWGTMTALANACGFRLVLSVEPVEDKIGRN